MVENKGEKMVDSFLRNRIRKEGFLKGFKESKTSSWPKEGLTESQAFRAIFV